MRPKMPWILFAISLALNVFFAGGVIYSKMTAERLEHSPGQRTDYVAEQLNLSDSQREGLVALRTKVRERWGARRDERGGQRGALMAELVKPELDLERLEALIRDRSDQRIPRFKELARDLHAYLATLSPEQREQFVAMSEKRGFFYRLISGPRRDGAYRR